MEITREQIVEAVNDGNHSMAAIAKALGMSAGGSANKKLQAVMPDLKEILVSIKSGEDVWVKEPSEEEGRRPVSTTAPTATPEQVHPAVIEQPVHQPNPFNRNGGKAQTLHSTLYDIGSEKEISISEFVEKGVEATGRPEHTIRCFAMVLSNPNDRHNNHVSRNVCSREGRLLLARA